MSCLQELRKTDSLADMMTKKLGGGGGHEDHDDPDLQLTCR